MKIQITTAVVAALSASSAGAQGQTDGGGVLKMHRISAQIAHEMVGAAVASCAGQGYKVSAVARHGRDAPSSAAR
jgi:hypothetical protein